MKTSDFSFDLPQELIAQYPTEKRGDSRMLVCDPATAALTDTVVTKLPDHVRSGSVLVLNNTKVVASRVFARTEQGARVEIFLIERTNTDEWKAMVARSRRRRAGTVLALEAGGSAVVTEVGEELSMVRFEPPIDEVWLERHGHVPLPPYITRPDEALDRDRYQTVYAAASGSVAAPTAGLHFTHAMLAALRERGVTVVEITLHVGLGTFRPIRTETIEAHTMHEERYEIGAGAAATINAARDDGRDIIAVGTTVLRTLESAWNGTALGSGGGSTRLYVRPGFRFNVVTTLFTNFHTPGSTLLVLVSAFGGLDFLRKAYRHAVAGRYRFFSYGDAMLLHRAGPAERTGGT